MPYTPPPELVGLSLGAIAELVEAQKLPPVEIWEPAVSGDSEMRIAADGRWYHQGSEIARPAMVRAFSRLLRREADGSFWLVTPHQKLTIAVEDAPFMVIDARSEGKGETATLALRLNIDELLLIDADHPLIFRGSETEPRLYVSVRSGLEARVNRAVFIDLAHLALANAESRPDGTPGLWSSGTYFALEPAP